ncbi:hypothetical protein Kpol_543p70 [Vanderwaltozyma polyspora DSM 70294]|uniref:Rab-GAP TBC domain-containing protein n=1 Tax=Vanderwaltozyma polyspora (strain ATCC 22028 / DSM 70294 / BCRC 21397 / CBS 2163 / NBRC 10782 / NRRL Y-8283 / UCD 57-17) TaxID=436907 RepID=A7THS4_VANPO|nr:uncharacterized protein Kpol_543p70 [Vanderwaltozyma polyspora DSM 70294]EDO18240.1 hypothetical protein Kpol_543p70 [Vanderwaltozyma polyspora DSM 70294]
MNNNNISNTDNINFRELALTKYGTIQQLIQQGIWRGEFYSKGQLTRNDRGWLWKTIVLHSDLDCGPDNNIKNNNDNNDNNNDSNLLPVPIVTDDNADSPLVGEPTSKNNGNGNNDSSNRTHNNHNDDNNKSNNDKANDTGKKLNRGIRRLTPIQTLSHPLNKNSINEGNNATKNTVVDDESISMSLSDTLDIIDLDLSRLLLDPIFQENKVHAQMRQILYNYMIILQKNEELNTTIKINRNYQQGFHEILGLIYLQLYQTSEDDDRIAMMNILKVYTKLMKQVVPNFYTRSSLISWETEKFQPILEKCSTLLYDKLYIQNDEFSNLIWLLRWTRLLFIRELPMDYVVIIWDHILTFQYPLDIFMVCLIITLLLNIFEDIIDEDEDADNDELIEKLLHYKKTSGVKLIDCVELCKIAGNLCELWSYENYEDMMCICDTFVKVRVGEEKFNRLNEILKDKAARKNANSNVVDPNRKRLEEKLKNRVKRLTINFKR